jgi:hypothetical protein
MGTTFTDQTQFSGETLHSAAGPRVLQDERFTIAAETPGFATLSKALRSAQRGRLDPIEIARYCDALGDRLDETREQLHQLAVPDSVLASLRPVLNRTDTLLETFDTVLDLVEDYLQEGSSETLQAAICLLDRIQEDFIRLF